MHVYDDKFYAYHMTAPGGRRVPVSYYGQTQQSIRGMLMHPDRSLFRSRPFPKSPQPTHSSDITPEMQQLRVAREYTLRCMHAPRLRRKEERRALVAARSEHR